MTDTTPDLHTWDDSYGADSYGDPAETLAEFRSSLRDLCDALNEPYGWGWSIPDEFSTEDETAIGPVFHVHFVMPRKGATFSVAVAAKPEQEAELAQIVRDTVAARIETIWDPFLAPVASLKGTPNA